jgi:hypothetical protein
MTKLETVIRNLSERELAGLIVISFQEPLPEPARAF